MKLEFPKNFYWGSATSAHQVEGNNRNDWTEWEHGNSARLAAEAARRHANVSMRIPDYILERYPNPLQEENYISGRACDHYHRFREDFDIAKQLGHNAHRFSIEWSRIEPEEGKFDEKEIEHYRQVISALKERGIEPFATLWHWTNPIWFQEKGGWLNKSAPEYFERYVNKIALSLKDVNVNFWITLNEPEIHAGNSYLKGCWPPQEKNLISCLRVIKNLIKAHRKSYKTIKEINLNNQVGIAKDNIYFEGWPISFFSNWLWNEFFLDKIRDHQDFVGLNYYFHRRFPKNENKAIADMNWEICPAGIFHVLKGLKKYNKPIYITENGLADAKDEKRTKFIKEHLFWTQKAIQEGVDVRGYFHWSLLDNFEWDKGFWPRFGLVEMDYRTLQRKIRPSAREYKKIISYGALT